MAANIEAIQLFKALADETRLQTLLLITGQGELCVCELTAALEQSQPKISRHLAQLRTSGILSDRRQGQWVYYQLSPALPSWARDILCATLLANKHTIEIPLQRLCKTGDRPERQAACCP